MISYTIAKHATAFPSKVLARTGGAHIYNITLTKNHDNGEFVGKGDWIELDRYKEGTPTSFEGVVREQANNGEYYVEVVSATNAYFIYQVPMIEEEYNNSFKKEENFYNAKDDTVRCYELKAGDIIALSVKGFMAEPDVDDTVVLDTTGKLKVQ